MKLWEVWFEIKWHFGYNWRQYIGVFLVLIVIVSAYWGYSNNIGRKWLEKSHQEWLHNEMKELLAEGKLVSLRNTGSFSAHDMELKFEDGSVILMTYSFCRRNNIREGKSYRIWESSLYGSQCQELEENTHVRRIK